MEFRQLRYFLAVAEHLHFTEAAAHLGIAQPPLSQQIIKLEREIGTPLFVRFPRRVELTEAGRLLRESARRIVEDAQQALVEAQNAGRGESGRLALGFAGSTVFHPMLAILVQKYRNAYPRVAISCAESNSSVLLDWVAERRVDAALLRVPLNCGELVVELLAEEDMIAVLPSNHRLSQQPRIDLAELAGDSFIFFPRPIGPDLYDFMTNACHAAGFTPTIGMESPQISATANFVGAGFGVTLIPASIRQIHTEGVTYHELKGKPLRTGIALVHRQRERAPTVLNFVKIVKGAAQVGSS
jgi:DNA-binding transcriptional LysR family regulator